MKQTKILLSAFAALAALMLAGCSTSPKQEETAAHEVVLPGEQAPPMDPGQNNFGGSAADRGDTTGRAERLRTVHFNDLSMSDPFIYPDPETKTYYLTSSGGRLWKSKDLVMWEGPYNVIDLSGTWCEHAGGPAAAEIHKVGDYYYYAGTWSDHGDLIEQVPRRYNVPHNQTYLLHALRGGRAHLHGVRARVDADHRRHHGLHRAVLRPHPHHIRSSRDAVQGV